jgi:hypothetical protein
MKKGKLVAIINENTESSYLSNMNEDSFYDGYKFVEYGKNIDNISLLLPSTDVEDFSIDKNKVVVNWGVKFQMRNSGVDGVEISVLTIQAPIIATGDAGSREVEINYGEYRFNVIKEKIVESRDVQIYVTGIEVDVEQKLVNVTVSI